MKSVPDVSGEPMILVTTACKRPSPHEFTVVQLSDLHFGATPFAPGLADKVVAEVNELGPDLVIVSGDLTVKGYRQEFVQAKEWLATIECPDVLVVPGNHDTMNAGYVHYADLIGPRRGVIARDGAVVVGLDSTQPDLHEGRIGRTQYGWIEEQLFGAAGLRIVALHHHLMSVPETGRERNVCCDAGDVLRVLLQCETDLVLSGHKHVPFAWSVDGLAVVTGGTCCSGQTRGAAEPSYNIIHSDGKMLTVTCRPSM